MKIKFKLPYLRRGSYIIFLCSFLFVLFFKNYHLDNDSWFLLNHGRYVFEYGIPMIEPFTIHGDFNFVMQQWLSSLIFYIFYNFFGSKSLLFLLIVVNYFIFLICYKICMLLSDNNYKISYIISLIIDFLLLLFYIVVRPQIFTFIFILLLIYCLELYMKKKIIKYLFFLPILSLLQINFHASMWWMLYIFMLPYLFDGLNLKNFKSFILKKLPLLAIMIVMFLSALLNPYGIEAIMYFFESYGVEAINKLVSEMWPLDINSVFGKMAFMIIGCIIFLYFFVDKKRIKVRYLLLLVGTIYLVLSSCKGFSYFILASFFPFAYYFKDVPFKINYEKEIYNKKYKINIVCSCIIVIVIFFITYFTIGVDYSNPLKEGIDLLLDKYNKEEIVLFVGYNQGGYTEFREIKSYLDPRAEVFLKSNNGKDDVFFEYYDLCIGVIDFEDIINKYNFTHLLVTETERMYSKMSKISGFSLFYEGELFGDEKYRIYVRNDLLIK